uniref:C2H2-type domain-containing protein n=1 Tax=Clytia hemisphaerica TaxID=252671 RepID=A0A7M5UBV0_9CNID
MLPEQQTHKCRDKNCTKRFFFLAAKNLHEELAHGLAPTASLEEPKENIRDDLYKYSCSRLYVGLLLLNANDPVKEGDGDRLIRFYNIYTFIFRMNGNDKYAYICLRLKARELALMSPRDFHRLKWNRFVNNHGGRAQNISLDLRLEHINKVTKALIKSQGMQNLTDDVSKTFQKPLEAWKS